MPYARELSVVLLAYALGSVSTGYYLLRLRTGQDIRRLGSGTAGSRNVARTVGLAAAAITLAGDAAKGALAVGAAVLFGRTIYFPAQEIHFQRDNPKAGATLIVNNDARLGSDQLCRTR